MGVWVGFRLRCGMVEFRIRGSGRVGGWRLHGAPFGKQGDRGSELAC